MTRMSRRLLALPLVLALMTASPALAATTGTSGYNQSPPKPSSGTGPSRETAKPKTTPPAPATSTTPTTTATPSPSHATTLPFTGLDLRWVIGVGVLLIGAGLSIRVVQRRQRHGLGR
jgi:hypothetical protein